MLMAPCHVQSCGPTTGEGTAPTRKRHAGGEFTETRTRNTGNLEFHGFLGREMLQCYYLHPLYAAIGGVRLFMQKSPLEKLWFWDTPVKSVSLV